MTNEREIFWCSLRELVMRLGCTWRAQVRSDGETWISDWGSWLSAPVPGYLEGGTMGPVPIRSVDWIELSTLRNKRARGGELISFDYLSAQIKEDLRSAKVEAQLIEGNFRIDNPYRLTEQ